MLHIDLTPIKKKRESKKILKFLHRFHLYFCICNTEFKSIECIFEHFLPFFGKCEKKERMQRTFWKFTLLQLKKKTIIISQAEDFIDFM